MRHLFLSVLSVVCITFTGNSQVKENQVKENQTNTRPVKTEYGAISKSVSVPELTKAGVKAMFVTNKIPKDFPRPAENQDMKVYRKMVQGYINSHAVLIIPGKAKELGFTYPVPKKAEEGEIRNAQLEMMKRKEPVSEEEKKLKAEKQAKLNEKK
jgi:hypothetical protein